MDVGVFDTGRGGELVAERLRKLAPEYTYHVVNDLRHAPYGGREAIEIQKLTDQAIQPLLVYGIIILACNTATVSAINFLRQKYPAVKFIGFEPMIRPASELSANRHITLLATAATKQSVRFQQLLNRFASDLTVDMPDTKDWAKLIDENETDKISFQEVAVSVNSGSDCIILGCTHYLALEETLQRQFPLCAVIEPTEAIARRLREIYPPPNLLL